MRENRTSGSEGGETGQPVFPTPIPTRRAKTPVVANSRRLIADSCWLTAPNRYGQAFLGGLHLPKSDCTRPESTGLIRPSQSTS